MTMSAQACMERTFNLLDNSQSLEESYDLLDVALNYEAFCSTPMNYKRVAIKSMKLTKDPNFYFTLKL